MLALSSLSNSSRYVGILYAALIFFSQALFGVLCAVDRQHRSVVDVVRQRTSTQIGDVIFRLPPRYDTPWPVSLAGDRRADRRRRRLVLERRVRGVEVIA